MKRAVIGAVLAIIANGAARAQVVDDVPTFRSCMDEVMGSLRSVVAPAEEAAAITMNLPDPVPPPAPAPVPEEEPDMVAPPPPPPKPVQQPPLDQLLALACPVMRIEAGDVALAQYCDPAATSDRWTCAVRDDGDAVVTFAP